jgi:hypothetical protein
VGRYCGCRRRGGTNHPGKVEPLTPGEYGLQYLPNGDLITIRHVPFPAGSTRWQARSRRIPTIVWIYTAVGAAMYFIISHPPPGESYEVEAAWWDDWEQVSEWCDPQLWPAP